MSISWSYESYWNSCDSNLISTTEVEFIVISIPSWVYCRFISHVPCYLKSAWAHFYFDYLDMIFNISFYFFFIPEVFIHSMTISLTHLTDITTNAKNLLSFHAGSVNDLNHTKCLQSWLFHFSFVFLLYADKKVWTCRWGKRYYLYIERNIQSVLINFTWLNRHGFKLVYLCLTWKCDVHMQKVWCIENIEIHSAAMEMTSVLQEECFLPTNSSSKSVDFLWLTTTE